MLSRRELLLTPAALMALRAGRSSAEAAGGRMSLALHQNTSSRAGFRASLEGWARAGITQVEITSNLLDQFVKTDSLAAARRVFADLNLTPVSGACGVTGLIEPSPERAAALDSFKKRSEQWAELGIPKIYSTTATSIKPTADDYKAAVDNVREFGEVAKQFQLTAMFEFVRTSTFASTLTTLLSITRAAGQPHVGPLFDCYHFWSGLNKMEDLDTVKPGEIKHVHFQDVPDMPRELLDTTTRVIPGDGVTPLTAILQKLDGQRLRGPAFRRAVPAEVLRGRSVRGRARDQDEGGSGHAEGEGALTDATASRIGAAGWRIVLLASLGGTLEFYDFVVFGIFARDIADAVFPAASPLASLMASFAAFAAGYLARPIGGIVLSHFGDRHGRRAVFLWSVFVMSAATLGMGLVPPFAAWGSQPARRWSLLRMVQGLLPRWRAARRAHLRRRDRARLRRRSSAASSSRA